jgi:hypothetical protein
MELNGIEILFVVFNGIEIQFDALYDWRLNVDAAIGTMTRIFAT